MGFQAHYLVGMLRSFIFLIWLSVGLVFSFDAIAQPCNVRAELQSSPEHAVMNEMPCHDTANMDADETSNDEMPMSSDACCCAALLKNISVLDYAGFVTPLPTILAWADPLPDHADSISFEYEPPPPRA